MISIRSLHFKLLAIFWCTREKSFLALVCFFMFFWFLSHFLVGFFLGFGSLLFVFGFLGSCFGGRGSFWHVGWFRNRNKHMSKGPFGFPGLAARKGCIECTGSLFEIPTTSWRKKPLSFRFLSSEISSRRRWV